VNNIKSNYIDYQNASAGSYYISCLKLYNFRNYENLRLDLNQNPVVLTGHNGSGKTNILESISLLSPGKGLRKIKISLADRISQDGSVYPWSISAIVNIKDQKTQIGTGRNDTSESKRAVKIDMQLIKKQSDLAAAFSVMWLVPQMDGLFVTGSSDRRKFMDRLVYNFDSDHASRIYSYEYVVRERAKLLQENYDHIWLSALEDKIAQKAVSIAAARIDTMSIIQDAVLASKTAFPKCFIAVDGQIEKIVSENKSLQAEEIIKKQLFQARVNDTRTGRASVGTHRSDLSVIYIDKNMPASLCSTGEQKALLLSIILAEAKAKAYWTSITPVILLDEVVAHLDESRRISLFNEILDMKAQVWMTGTDVSLFDSLNSNAQFLEVDNAVVSKDMLLEY
jgi:DNA replication and repair protein RecF